ncbi:MAG: ATP-binding protein [Desulfobacter sp.]|nr:MAG: ATP-binding protein [Desulfobacter sp.]
MANAGNIYELSRQGNGLEIRFSSSLAKIDDACNAVSGFLESMGPDLSSQKFAVNLVLREGLTNAVRHGNKNDPAKVVKLCLSMATGNSLQISIEDQGAGFDWKRICRTPMDEAADHGRGMVIMETYCDRCRYNERGNTLYLEKVILQPGKDIHP